MAEVKTAILGADFLAHHGLLVNLRDHCLIDLKTALNSRGKIQKTFLFDVSTIGPAGSLGSVNDEEYLELLREFIDVTQSKAYAANFSEDSVQHHIATSGSPVYDRPQRLAGEKLLAPRNDFDMLLQAGVIRPSSSPWSSPIHLVRKKQGGWRTTGDYRRLNVQTIPDRYSVPFLEDIFQQFLGMTVFTTIDLVRA